MRRHRLTGWVRAPRKPFGLWDGSRLPTSTEAVAIGSQRSRVKPPRMMRKQCRHQLAFARSRGCPITGATALVTPREARASVGGPQYCRPMLRRLDPKTQYRSLGQGFWPSNIALGKRTIIYGHNGSGKSTLSDLLLEIAAGTSPIDATWEDENGVAHKIVKGGGGPPPSMAVFTKSWVRKNLSQFLEGAGASPIVTLGEEAIEAKEQEQELVEQVEEFRTKAKDAEKRGHDHAAKAKKLATAAQDAIADQLKEFDYERFTKSRYSMPVVEGKLRAYKGEFPDESKHAEALKRLGEGAAERVSEIADPPDGLADALEGLEALLTETPTSVALDSLAADQGRQAWAERGIHLHEELDECLFCGNPITEERRQQLAKHFDKSWFEIRERAQALLGAVQRANAASSGWLKTLADPKDLVSELRDGYGEHLRAAKPESVDG